MDEYLDCLSREAKVYMGTECSSIYVGGGTPSLLEADQLKKLFQIIKNNFMLQQDGEFTFESNPESLNSTKLEILRACGINRISLGVQSFNAAALKYLGRNHGPEKARETYALIRAAGFTNVNVDLMFSFPQQTLDEIRQDVREVVGLGSEHISLYMLNLEENSRFHAQKIKLPDGDLQAQQYLMVVAALKRAGYGQYEISNFAKPGKESRHNLNYWQGGEYIGLGIGAHSYQGGRLFWNVSRLNVYMDKIHKGDSVVEGFQQLDAYGQLKQVMLIGLRMSRGVPVGSLEKSFGSSLQPQEREKIENFIRHGFFVVEDGYLKATEKGRLVLDELCAQLS